MSEEYVCEDPACGHPFEKHNSVIVPFGCTAVDGTSVDCVNGYQGKRPPRGEGLLDTIRGVGWISQVQNPDGVWLSWTQYTTQNRSADEARDLARSTVEALLTSERYDFVRGRIVRADWTVEELLNPPATNPEVAE